MKNKKRKYTKRPGVVYGRRPAKAANPPKKASEANPSIQRPLFYHSQDRRFIVAGVIVGDKIRMGVAVTKKADPWSPADQYRGSLGEAKAAGKAKSKLPNYVMNKPEGDDMKKIIGEFRLQAYKVGARVVATIDAEIEKDIKRYYEAEALLEKIAFYFSKRLNRRVSTEEVVHRLYK